MVINYEKQYEHSVAICKLLNLPVSVKMKTDYGCTNRDCDIEPPSMTSRCPACDYHTAHYTRYEVPYIDFNYRDNDITLTNVCIDLKIPILIDGSKGKVFTVGNDAFDCGRGNNLIEAVANYLNKLKETNKVYKINEFQKAVDKASWRLY